MTINYLIDGIDIKTFGVHVSASDGLLSRPELKEPLTVSWEGYHGDVIDLEHKYYKAREIKLTCFITAASKSTFITQCNNFFSLFDQTGTRRLMVSVDSSNPLVYEVYLSKNVDVDKKWSDANMTGTFTLELKEPEPVKKVLKYIRTSDSDKTVSITVTSSKLLNIYWGDGSHTYDVGGTSQTIAHSYSIDGTYYIVITGNIDEITSLTTTGTVLWNKL
jgi:hypothetical protein